MTFLYQCNQHSDIVFESPLNKYNNITHKSVQNNTEQTKY